MGIYDPRIAKFLSVDPIANIYSSQSAYVFAANIPISLIDVQGMGPGDPLTHTVKKGDDLTKISKKYGVSIEDIAKMNGIKDVNKISVGQKLEINPEANFSKNPRGSYQNPNNAIGEEVSVDKISEIGTDFVLGLGNENSIITGGGALKSVQNWEVVKGLIKSSVDEIGKDGKFVPGEVAFRSFRAGSLPSNIKKGIVEYFKKLFQGEDGWENNSQNSPIHVLGSFNISVRVNANGTTATVCVYDSKTFKSFSDGNASSKSNTKRGEALNPALTNTYQRYLWNIELKKK